MRILQLVTVSPELSILYLEPNAAYHAFCKRMLAAMPLPSPSTQQLEFVPYSSPKIYEEKLAACLFYMLVHVDDSWIDIGLGDQYTNDFSEARLQLDEQILEAKEIELHKQINLRFDTN